LNAKEAKRYAHGAIAGLILAHLEFDDNDLWVEVAEWSDEDQRRFANACEEIADYHRKRGPTE
jgi:hypothetical protein